MEARVLVVMVLLAGCCDACLQLLDGWKQVSVEERARRAQIAFRGLAVTTYQQHHDSYAAQFWIINVYKGAEKLAEVLDLDPGNGGVYNLRDRRLNVSQFDDKTQCYSPVTPQKYYIVFAELRGKDLVAKYDDLFGAAADWSEENEERVWAGAGWEPWSEWSSCSASCGDGSQERRRFCRENGSCHGYNKERRHCNMFSCQGAVYPLDIEDRRFFHPSRSQWDRVPGRPTAWRLRPNSYIWVPSSELFPAPGHSHTGNFPREFTLLVTLRLHPQSRAQGTVFSLRSRRQQDAYLSLELAGPDQVKLVHAGPNGTQTVDIPAPLGDGNWHQLALGLHDDSSVKSYLDCAWVSTDILKRNSLDTPEDSDVVIGYLFLGDLEQLVIVPNPAAVGQQCSASRVPLLDPTLLQASPQDVTSSQSVHGSKERRGKRTKGRKGVDYRHSASSENFSQNVNQVEDDMTPSKMAPVLPPGPLARKPLNEVLENKSSKMSLLDARSLPLNKAEEEDEDIFEGSGSEGSEEVEWSEWSDCSSSCGTGSQSRYSRCVDDGSRLELCMEAGGERTETRACTRGSCPLATTHRVADLTSAAPSAAPLATTTTTVVPAVQEVTTSPQPDIFFSSSTNQTSDYDLLPVPKKGRNKHRKGHHKFLSGNNTALNTSGWTLGKTHDHNQGLAKPCSCLNGGLCHMKRRSCHCPPGYFGRHCERISCSPGCQNGGRCYQPDLCSCPDQFTGSHCHITLCTEGCSNGGTCVGPGLCECPEGFLGALCEEPSCHLNCLHGGRCVGPGLCSCPSGWDDADCSTPVCEPGCRHGGQCVKPHVCHCPTGTSGSYCQNFSCRLACLNGGACVGPDQCECPRNATGSTCEEPVCDPPCENGATCVAGNRCLCDAGSSGTRCEKRKCEYRPYQEPYTRGFRRLVSRRLETKCDPWGWKTCVRNQPEYQTVYKTFYRTVYKCADNHH